MDARALAACAEENEAAAALYHDFLAGRLSHATLLAGESGIGKKTLARLLALGLMCRAEGDRPCGQCRNCRRVLARTHPDALFPVPLPKEKTIKVETLRDTLRTLAHHPLEDGARVVVIENAERMTPQAQNCLLKTLEETDAGTYFLLTCDAETALLPTIRSRCRCVRMQPWPAARVERALLDKGVEAGRAHALSRYCEGSLGRALAMQEDETYWQARALVRDSFFSVRGIAGIPAAARKLKDQKDQGDRLLDILEQELRALMRSRALGEEDPADDFPALWREAPVRGIRSLLEAVIGARRQKSANVGWPSLSEGLLQTIAEETATWQV